jgi:hypothetical protein
VARGVEGEREEEGVVLNIFFSIASEVQHGALRLRIDPLLACDSMHGWM